MLRRPPIRRNYAPLPVAFRPRVLPMTEHDRIINAQLRERAGDPRDLIALRVQRHRRQRLVIGFGLLALLVSGVLAMAAAL